MTQAAQTAETKHTPASLEWRYVPAHVAEGPSQVRHVEGWLVCETCSDEYARLIAAAPAMLKALREIDASEAEYEGNPEDDERCRQALKAARAAITKAEGRQS